MTKNIDLTLGLILLKDGKLTKDQLKKALLKQGEIRRFGRVSRLGEVIVKLGLLREDEVAAALAIQETVVVPTTHQTALGLLLIDAGLVTPTQVFEALVAQQAGEQRLGEILIARGLLTPEQLAPFFDRQAAQRVAAGHAHDGDMRAAGLGPDDEEFVVFDMG